MMPRRVIVTKYNPEWPKMYAREVRRILEILGDNCAPTRMQNGNTPRARYRRRKNIPVISNPAAKAGTPS